MGTVFEKTNINGMEIKNRIVRSATWEGMCDPDGRPTQKLMDCYSRLVQGQVGLIISGYTYVSENGKQQPGKAGIYSDAFETEYKQLTRAVHQEGGKVVMQLVHAGGQALSKHSGFPPVAPSAITVAQYSEPPEALSVKQIDDLVIAFANGAKRAKAWGFDGVQLHGAHGYLINQFLSPLTNRRTDEFGGSLKNRMCFLVTVYNAIREAVGADYPVMIKLNGSDNLEGGLSASDALTVACELDAIGIDAIEVSSGTSASGQLGPARSKVVAQENEGYNLSLAAVIKKKVSCPVMVVGGFRSIEVIEKAVEQVDYVALSRPLIWQPDLVSKWQSGNRKKAKCVSCNRCFLPGQRGGILCMTEKKLAQRAKKNLQ